MKVGILGLGLIGGSMARAYAVAGHTVYAADLDESTLSFAMLSGAVHGRLDEETIPACELLLLAIYPGGSAKWLEDNGRLVDSGALVLDLCGIKQEVCKRCFPVARKYGFTFVGSHPMAGSHFSGFKYSRADLYKGAPMVLVPPRFDDIDLLQRVKDAMAPCGFGMFSVTTAEEHDRMIAFTSQMPHVLSNAFIKSPTARQATGLLRRKLQGPDPGGLAECARMWAELFLENRDNVLFELDTYLDSLTAYRDALEARDGERLTALLEAGKKAKEEVDG